MFKKQRFICRAAVFLTLFFLSGCLPSHVKPVLEVSPQPLFPPQAVMNSGDYKGFLTKNSQALNACPEPDRCAVALLNLCFVYGYPKSPYYDPPKALRYISDLIAGAPRSPWAAQALVWRELIARQMKEKNRCRLMTRERLKSQEADLQNKADREKDWQVDRQILEDEIRSKDQIIAELTRQINGARKIDLEMKKKEKGLLH